MCLTVVQAEASYQTHCVCFSSIIFLRQAHDHEKQRVTEEALESDRHKLCLSVNVWTSLNHTCLLRAVRFQQCHHRLLQRDSLKLSSFVSFLRRRHHCIAEEVFIYFFNAFNRWLTSRGVTSVEGACTYCTSRYSRSVHVTAFFSLFCSRVHKHCFSLSFLMTININNVFLWNYCKT